jgi:FkbH-like protein
MKTLSEIISLRPVESLSNYFSIARKIDDALNRQELSVSKQINIALLSSSTINGIKEALRVQCGQLDLLANVYVSGYSQYAQEIFNPDSGLYKSEPTMVIINIDTKAIAGNYFFLPYETSEQIRQEWVNETTDFLANLAVEICKKNLAKVILHNLEVPVYSPLGIMENKQDFGFIESIENVNKGLRDRFKNNNQVFVFDYDSFCSRVGKDNVLDYKMYYLGDIKLRPQLIPILIKDYMRYIRALASMTKKCIVLDLDNTLWGGVIGENGMDGIHLDPTTEGRPFVEFQQCLLSLFNRGIILAINSKNNPEDALEVIRSHPYMILREKHFAAMRMNWNNKVENMKSLAQELNIGLESFVFLDDDHMNREMVNEFLPEVTVVDMPRDPALYVSTLMNLNLFDSLALTEEDKNKGEMYFANKKRRELVETATDLTDYLKMLDISVFIEKACKENIPRISQLTQKTNQFNTTTRRYTEEAIINFVQSNKFLVVSIRVSDKFGDNGLTGLSIVEKGNDVWRIDSFLLSCRVLGRRAEEALLAFIIKEAKNEGIYFLQGEFIQSKKNEPASHFYKNNGFEKLKDDDDIQTWQLNLSGDYSYPDFIKVEYKNELNTK